jgi:hypothetical protein
MEEAEQTTATKKIGKWEIFWIVLDSLIGAAGLFFITIGIVGDYMAPTVKADGSFSNWILDSQTKFEAGMKTALKFQLSYRWFGVCLLIIAAFIAVITLNFFAKKRDVNDERALRRAQRLQVLSQSAPEAPAPVVEAKAEDKPSAPAAK